jgi:hypothetical protein
MTRYATIETIDPQAVIKSIAEKIPTSDVLDEAKKTGKRTLAEVRKASKQGNKAVRRWWRGLPNDGVRVSLPIAAVLAVAGITAGVILIRRRF